MNIPLFINIIFLITIIIPIITVLSYGLLLIYYGTIKKNAIKVNDLEKLPSVTILIPCYNEERVIRNRLENILNYDYPKDKLRVIFIDDSNDETPNIITEYMEKHNYIEMLRLGQRSGYSKAVEEGLNRVTTDLVILNEAGSFPLPETLKKQVSILSDPLIGAVTGKSIIVNTDEHYGNIESLYLKIIDYLRTAESNMDTTIFIKGEATGYKTELVKNIKAVADAGSIDTSMAFLVRKNGYKTVYHPEVVFREYAPADEAGFVKVKKIRAANIMRNIIIYKEMILNPKYGKFGLISLPFYISAFFIIPVLIPVSIIISLFGLLFNPNVYSIILGALGASLIVFYLFARNTLTLLYQLEISILQAIWEIYFKRKDHAKIERVESTRRTTIQ
ncbi:glycosyltransferase [Candidatus Bathyarchaeota archaeon]|nr:MAG: glycosyltransferase [Candidatus Bathyarchaeota archaeon]